MPKKQGGDKLSLLERIFQADISIGSVSLVEKAIFAKHLSVMAKSGMTISDSLIIIYSSAKGKFKRILKGIVKSVQSGNSLSESFLRYPKVFDGLFVSAVRAGESSGTLEENFKNLAEQLEKEKDLTSKIKGALLYPVIVLIAAFFLGLAMTFLVLPKITPLFEGLRMELPFTTRALISFSHFVQSNTQALIIGILAIIILLAWLVKRPFAKPITHALLLRAPIAKDISKNTNLSRFCRTMGTLLKNGLNVDEAIETTARTMNNYYYRSSLLKVSQRIAGGTKISENLKSYENLYPLMVTSMVKVGEESGGLEETLLYLADFYELEVENATKSLTTAIEPLLLLFIGLVVGFLALSIITPIYSITSGIS
jgi:type II secretory pathway component PulF